MTRRLPSLNALRAFEAAARHASFARAAEELHVTPAAISQQIRQLEDSLGVSLFRRGKILALSEAASLALPLISEAFDRLERAAAQLRADRRDGPLVVSVPPAFAARWLVPRLDDFHNRHPDLELRLLATRRRVDFAVEDVDMALRFGPGPYPGLYAERLMTEVIVPVAVPALAAAIKRPEDLLSCTLLHDDSHEWDPAFPDWDTWLASLGVTLLAPLRIRHYGDINLVIQAAASGLGVALAWHSLVADELHGGRLVRLLDRALPTNHGYHLVVPHSRLQLPKVTAFRDWLLGQAVGHQHP
jgi:LysR family glycine cleavage system transcriptional activator